MRVFNSQQSVENCQHFDPLEGVGIKFKLYSIGLLLWRCRRVLSGIDYCMIKKTKGELWNMDNIHNKDI